MQRRDSHQRRAYAMRRMSLAVDRMIVTRAGERWERAARWVEAWRRAAGIRRPEK